MTPVNARRIILIVLGLLVVYGLVNFVSNSVQTRAQLAEVASKDSAMGDRLQIRCCLGIPYQRADGEARGGECGAGRAAQESGCTGDQDGLSARTHEDDASSAARSCSAWAATRRALAIRVSVRPFAGMKRQLDPSAT